MLRRLIPAFLFAFVSTLTALGQDAAEQAFIDYHTARAIDAKCHFLRYFELSVVRDIELNALRPLWFTGAHEAGKIDDEEYLEAYNKLADMGEQTASGIDCANEAAAAPYILKLREQISVLIYADLIIAVDGGALSDEQMRAAQAYEGMISPLYGENWQNFSEYARREAQFKFDESAQQDRDSSPFGGLWSYDDEMEAEMEAYGITSDGIYVDSLRAQATKVVDDILFDLSAADAGYRVRTEYFPDGSYVNTLADASGTVRYDLIDMPGQFELLEKIGSVNLVFAVNMEGDVRALTWGRRAREALADGSVTILANPTKLEASLATDYTYMRSQEWLDAAEIFTGLPLQETCLGAPCFGLPKAAVDTILSGSPNQAFRFFVSINPDPPLPSPVDMQVHTAFTYRLNSWVLYKQGQTQ